MVWLAPLCIGGGGDLICLKCPQYRLLGRELEPHVRAIWSLGVRDRPAGEDSGAMAPTVPTSSMESTNKSRQKVLAQQDHLGSVALGHQRSLCLFRQSLLFLSFYSFCFWLRNCHRPLNLESNLGLPLAACVTLGWSLHLSASLTTLRDLRPKPGYRLRTKL